jgi:hypothetical protein
MAITAIKEARIVTANNNRLSVAEYFLLISALNNPEYSGT